MLRKIFPIFLIAVSVVALLTIAVPDAAAINLFGQGVCDGRGADSVACQDSRQTGDPLTGPQGVITFAVNILSIIIGIAAVIVIIMAGLKLITSGSNPQDVTKAREMILYAVVGLVIAAFAQIIVRLFLDYVT